MNKEIGNLVELYFKKLNATEVNIYTRTKVFKDIETLIKQGYTIKAIETAISNNPSNYESILKTANQKGNLINLDKFYFHPFIQIAPSAPMVVINDDGTFTESYSNDEFYLQIKTSMTLDDIVEYFYSRFPNISHNKKRDMGAIKHVFETIIIPTIKKQSNEDMNELDLILFSIDTAQALSFDLDDSLIKGILDLGKYVDEALFVYNDKINYCKISGLCHAQ